MTGTDYLAIRYAIWLSQNCELRDGEYRYIHCEWNTREWYDCSNETHMIDLYNLFLDSLKKELF